MSWKNNWALQQYWCPCNFHHFNTVAATANNIIQYILQHKGLVFPTIIVRVTHKTKISTSCKLWCPSSNLQTLFFFKSCCIKVLKMFHKKVYNIIKLLLIKIHVKKKIFVTWKICKKFMSKRNVFVTWKSGDNVTYTIQHSASQSQS